MTEKAVRTVAVIGAGSIGIATSKNLESLGIRGLLAYEPNPDRSAQIKAKHPHWKFCADVSDFADETPRRGDCSQSVCSP